MTKDRSSTAAASSSVSTRMKDAVAAKSDRLDRDTLGRLKRIQSRVDELRERGLLKKQAYSSSNSGDFERRYQKR